MINFIRFFLLQFWLYPFLGTWLVNLQGPKFHGYFILKVLKILNFWVRHSTFRFCRDIHNCITFGFYYCFIFIIMCSWLNCLYICKYFYVYFNLCCVKKLVKVNLPYYDFVTTYSLFQPKLYGYSSLLFPQIKCN